MNEGIIRDLVTCLMVFSGLAAGLIVMAKKPKDDKPLKGKVKDE